MDDRELLEMAAKAAAINHVSYDGVDYDGSAGLMLVDEIGRHRYHWNPIADDGHALRLAVEMRMTVDVHLWRDEVQVRAYDKLRGGMYHVDESGETGAATRRAIVRAAAEIGKAMP